jgi:DUF305 family protein family protein
MILHAEASVIFFHRWTRPGVRLHHQVTTWSPVIDTADQEVFSVKHDHGTGSQQAHATGGGMMNRPYRRLLLMTGLSFLAMYALMYAMVDATANVYFNLNQLYMAGLMTAPMVLELGLMRGMYHRKNLNRGIAAAGVAALVAFWLLLRSQAAISDQQFLRSMIPHHAGALLMCGKAPIRDTRIVELCRSILAGQRAEIDQMKAMLR